MESKSGWIDCMKTPSQVAFDAAFRWHPGVAIARTM